MLSATATALGKPSDFMTFSPQPAGEKNAPSDGAARNQKIYHSSVNLIEKGGGKRRAV